MNETPQQYMQRMLAMAQGTKPLQVQAATPKKIARLIKGVPAAKLRKRPAPDRWSISEILAHLSETEIVMGYRIRLVLGAPGITLTPFDQDVWVKSGHYEKRDPRKSLEQFRVLREGNLALLNSLTPEQWKHHGLHAERGVETIEHMTRLFAGHDINHTSQIERILKGK